ncbi:MaoC family dehydratase [Mariniluteicoccus flavus]
MAMPRRSAGEQAPGPADTSLSTTTPVFETPRLATEFGRAVLTSRGRAGARGPLPATRLAQTRVRVDADHLARYQRLCGWPVSGVLPHTYPHVLGFPLQARLMADRSFPLPLAGLVHVRNETTVRAPLSLDDRPDAEVWAENLVPHAKGTTVDLCAAFRLDGEVVWESRSTYLHRGRPAGEAAAEPEAPAVPAAAPSAIWRLPDDLGRAYAAVSGDVNPIHLHPWTAKAMGFPRAIAHGMWTYARSLAALGPAVNGPSTSRVWFRKPVLLPSSVGLVVDRTPGRDVAALVSPKDASKVHLVLELADA